jgi:hypothetical protein
LPHFFKAKKPDPFLILGIADDLHLQHNMQMCYIDVHGLKFWEQAIKSTCAQCLDLNHMVKGAWSGGTG